MRTFTCMSYLLSVCCLFLCWNAVEAVEADALLQTVGKQRGLVVCSSATEKSLVTQLQNTDGILLELFEGSSLPYGENLIDIVYCADPASVPWTAAMQVVAPFGALVVAGQATVPPEYKTWSRVVAIKGATHTLIRKPALEGADDWSHWQHGPDNNNVSEDQRVSLKGAFQWISGPAHQPAGITSTISGGRIFTATGWGADHKREWNYLYKLTARSLYNGTVLWQRDLPKGTQVHRSAYVAQPDHFYYMHDGVVEDIEPETGKTLQTWTYGKESESLKWMVVVDDTMYLLAGPADEPVKTVRYAGEHKGTLAQCPSWENRVTGMIEHVFGFRIIAVRDGNVLWEKQEEKPIDARTCALRNNIMCYYTVGGSIVSLDANTGAERWRNRDTAVVERIDEVHIGEKMMTTPASLLMDDAYVLEIPARRHIIAFHPETGAEIWSYEKPKKSQFSIHILATKNGLLTKIAHPKKERGENVLINAADGTLIQEKVKFGGRGCSRITAVGDWMLNGASKQYNVVTGETLFSRWSRSNCWDGELPAGGLLVRVPMDCSCSQEMSAWTARGAFPSTVPETYVPVTRAGGSAKNNQSAPAPAAVRGHTDRNGFYDSICAEGKQQWVYQAEANDVRLFVTPTATAVFICGTDGSIRRVQPDDGSVVWQKQERSPYFVAPHITQGLVIAGSSDGFVSARCLETGVIVWRTQLTPQERRIPYYGQLIDTWPIMGPLIVTENSVVTSCGMLAFDGVYAVSLDIQTGQHNWAVRLPEAAHNQGGACRDGEYAVFASGAGSEPLHVALADGRIKKTQWDKRLRSYRTGGSFVGRIADGIIIHGGRMLHMETTHAVVNNGLHVFMTDEAGISKEFRIPEISRIPPVWNERFFIRMGSGGTQNTNHRLICWDTEQFVARYRGKQSAKKAVSGYYFDKQEKDEDALRVWEVKGHNSMALLLCRSTVVSAHQVGGNDDPQFVLTAFNSTSGAEQWSQPLPAMPVVDGLSACGDRLFVALQNGSVLCVQ